MSTEFYVDWEDRTYAPRLPAARPTDTFYSSDPQPIEVDYAGTRIEYGLLREAHTDGDLYIHFADHNVIVAGGAFTVGRYPLLDYATGGLIGGLINATESLIDLSDSETLVVPADGPAQNRNALEAQRDMLQTVRERVQALARQGKSVEEMLAAGITDEFEMRWGGNTRQFVANIYSSLWGLGR
jgi:cyclase